jgi:hypothetical protein
MKLWSYVFNDFKEANKYDARNMCQLNVW